MLTISKHSVMSLRLTSMVNNDVVGSATGFVVESAAGPLLFTNRHVLTGRDQTTGVPLHSRQWLPNKISIMHNRKNRLGCWVDRSEPLYDDEAQNHPRWREHPTLGSGADVVALPLTALADVQLFPYSPELPDDNDLVLVGPAEPVSVVGFPFGKAVDGSLAIWATGFVASDLDVDYQGQPVFLVDCRSRPGQSGSPVIAVRSGSVQVKTGLKIGVGEMHRFLGIYSGRINEQSDIGMVWKLETIKAIVETF